MSGRAGINGEQVPRGLRGKETEQYRWLGEKV